jgi:heme a synthase
MTLFRRLAYAALTLAFLHTVFGGVVRISGSGMGCGDNWPKCYGEWFPALGRAELVIEVTHRYFAAALLTVVAAVVVLALVRRREPGVGGRGGVLRAASLALALVVSAALLGAVTVFVGNTPAATAAHKVLAAVTLAVLAATVVRAGGLGGTRALAERGTARAARGARAGAALALLAVLMGALTAKVPGAAVACQGFPLCGEGSLGGGAQHVQLTHRVIAYLLAFHLLGLAVAFSRRRESPVVLRAARVAAALVLVQIALAASMVLLHLPAVLRSLHQATGLALWTATFTLAYLARQASAERAPAGDAAHAVGDRGAPLVAGTRP